LFEGRIEDCIKIGRRDQPALEERGSFDRINREGAAGSKLILPFDPLCFFGAVLPLIPIERPIPPHFIFDSGDNKSFILSFTLITLQEIIIPIDLTEFWHNFDKYPAVSSKRGNPRIFKVSS
jgi:hypothetical protein